MPTLTSPTSACPPPCRPPSRARIDRLDRWTPKWAAPVGRSGDRVSGSTPSCSPDWVLVSRRSDDRWRAELIDQVRFTPRAEFRVPASDDPIGCLRVATQVRSRSTASAASRASNTRCSADENAALIAEHLEAAGDLLRRLRGTCAPGHGPTAATIAAATSWRRAKRVADQLPDDDRDQLSMRIAPRTLLCATATRSGGSAAGTGFDELRQLCAIADDNRSLAIGMAGYITAMNTNGHGSREASPSCHRTRGTAGLRRRLDPDGRNLLRAVDRQVCGPANRSRSYALRN